MSTVPYLRLDRIRANRPLMRLLPPEIAYRFHALPVATDGYRITVAVASPEELNASDAISSAMHAPVCLVQADLNEIDQYLDRIWQQNTAPRLRFLHWYSSADQEGNREYLAENLSKLFGADITQVDLPWKGMKSFLELKNVIEQIKPDLFICPIHPSSWLVLNRLNAIYWFVLTQLTVPIFIPRNLNWPLKRILLVLPDSNTLDESTLLWTVQVSRAAPSAVTILPLLPQVPGVYGSFVKHDIKTILMAQDPLGQKLRSIADTFSEAGIQGIFKLRDGQPNDQLRDELEATDPDLVILATRSQGSFRGWGSEDPGLYLLKYDNRPLLITPN